LATWARRMVTRDLDANPRRGRKSTSPRGSRSTCPFCTDFRWAWRP